MQPPSFLLFRRCLTAVALLSCSSALSAQLTTSFLPGTASGQQFGFSVTQLGDLDGDGYPEWAASAPFNGSAGQLQRGAVFVYRGNFNTSLFNLFGDRPFEIFGVSVGNAGDVDKDGTEDIIVGSPEDDRFGQNIGVAKVFSGRTQALIRTISSISPVGPQARFGRSVEGLGDVNGDGFDDVAIGSIGNSRVQLVSGANNTTLGATPVGSSTDLGAETILRVGDLDGDGASELAVSVPGAAGGGNVRILRGGLVNGLHLRLLEQISAPGAQRFGSALELIEDVDGDGAPELAIGDPNANGGSGRLHIYSLSQRTIISSFDLQGPNGGRSIAQGADIDVDGIRDVWVGGAGNARWVSSRTGQSLSARFGSGDFGRAMATVWTRPGRAQVLASSPLNDLGATDGGGMTSLAFRSRGGFRRLGPQCPNSSGLSSASASNPRVGLVSTLRICGAPSSSQIFFSVGSELPTPLPLDAIGMPSCILYVQPWVSLGGLTDPSGDAEFNLPIPLDPSLIDTFFAFQAFAPDIVNPLGLVATDAARVLIGLP